MSFRMAERFTSCFHHMNTPATPKHFPGSDRKFLLMVGVASAQSAAAAKKNSSIFRKVRAFIRVRMGG